MSTGSETEEVPFLVARSGSLRFALRYAGDPRCEGTGRLQRPPRPGAVAGWLLGAGHCGGDVPVYDLRFLLGLPADSTAPSRRVLLLGEETHSCGLLLEASGERTVLAPALPAGVGLLERLGLRAWAGAAAIAGGWLPWLDPRLLHPDLALCGGGQEETAVSADDPALRPFHGGSPGMLTFGGAVGAGSPGDSWTFALSLAQVVEVVDVERIVALPGAPRWVRGLTGWRGRAVPVLDLQEALGEPSGAPAAGRRAVIARTVDPPGCLALLAAGEIKVRKLATAGPLRELPEALGLPARQALRGCAEVEGRIVLIPDLEAIVVQGGDPAGGPLPL
jgi:chemotaxis signal transduction protein